MNEKSKISKAVVCVRQSRDIVTKFPSRKWAVGISKNLIF